MKNEAMVSVHYVKGGLKCADIINTFQNFKKNINNEIFIWLTIELCNNSFLP